MGHLQLCQLPNLFIALTLTCPGTPGTLFIRQSMLELKSQGKASWIILRKQSCEAEPQDGIIAEA